MVKFEVFSFVYIYSNLKSHKLSLSETKIINSEISWYKNDTTLITQEIAKNENISINNDILRFLKLNHITNYGNYRLTIFVMILYYEYLE
jgi:hypothetical protein